MAYYDAFAAQWATLTGTTDQKLSSINALTVAGPLKDVPASSVIGYLALNAKLSGLLAYAASPPANSPPAAVVVAKELSAMLNMPSFTTFYLSNPQVAAALQLFLSTLASDPNTGLTAADSTALLALGNTTLPWWQSAGYQRAFDLGDVAAAGLS